MLYDDGEQEWLSFQSERVKWHKDEPAPDDTAMGGADADGNEEEEVGTSISPVLQNMQHASQWHMHFRWLSEDPELCRSVVVAFKCARGAGTGAAAAAGGGCAVARGVLLRVDAREL